MLRSAKSFLNTPIISLYNTTRIGSVLDFVVEPDIGKAIGIVVEKIGFFKKKYKVISIVDVREISKDAFIVDNEDVLVWSPEIIKVDEILKSGIKIFKNKVYTESGKYLGRASDFLMDQFFYVSKIYLKPSLSNIFETELIISRDLILKVTKDEIIVSDDLIKVAKDSEAVGAIE